LNTYFVLNKKDRSGITQSRPFQTVLAEMKRQEIEEAKLKQSANLKRESLQNSSVKENGFSQLTTTTNSKSIKFDEVSSPVKINNDENVSLHLVQNSLPKPIINNDQTIKSLQGRPRSRTCELL